MSGYDSLSRARLTYEYLHTNSTTHEFLFGALAELVDNARDAGATKTHIYTVPNESTRGKFILCFLDNGCGMDQVEVSQVIQFGRSSKRHSNSNLIGQYGNGLKSGSMRIGKDMLLFTRKGDVLSCLFLSRTFHEREKLSEVVVPMPSWNANTGAAVVANETDRKRHKTEVDIITSFSPFKTEEEVKAQFSNLKSSGTLVMIYNVKLMDNGEPELLVTKDKHDIAMADPHVDEVYDVEENVLPERVSFRAYVSVLYSEPRMKVYIEGKKVQTRRLISSLCKPRTYNYISTRFKKRSEQEVEKAETEAVAAEERCKELLIQCRELQQSSQLNKPARVKLQLAERDYEEAKSQTEYKRLQADIKKRSLKEPKSLSFTFGFNLERRRCDGMFIYNCNRLIRMYERIGPQTEGGVKCAGIVGVVDVPYLVLEPTHNKQDFANHKEYKHLLKSMADHMLQYWKDSKIESGGVTRFWDGYGYLGSWRNDPSAEPKYAIKRLMDVPRSVQCNSCLKWRELKFSRKMAGSELPEDWTCALNTDSNFQSCSKAEQKSSIPVGKLQRPVKNLEEKKAEEIKRLKERLEKAEDSVSSNQKALSPVPIQQSNMAVKSRVAAVTEIAMERRARQQEQATAYKPASPVHSKRAKPQAVRKMIEEEEEELTSPTKLPKTRPSAKKQPPPTMNRPSQPRQSQPQRQFATENRKKRRRVDSTGSIDEDTPIKRHRETKVSSTTKGSPQPLLLTDEDDHPASVPNSPLSSSQYEVNALVEARVNDRWYTGTVSVVKHVGSSRGVQIKVRFDKLGPDRWFAQSDSNLRLRQSDEHCLSAVPSPVNMDEQTNGDDVTDDQDHAKTEMPSTTTQDGNAPSVCVAADSSVRAQDDTLLESVSDLLRQCLCYFRAPDFKMEQDAILALTPPQLKDFPLTAFTEDYERKIRQLVGSQDSTRDKLKEVEDQNATLSRANSAQQGHVQRLEKELKTTRESLIAVRGNVNFLIRNLLTEKGNLQESDRSSHVDNLLEAIVCQIGAEK